MFVVSLWEIFSYSASIFILFIDIMHIDIGNVLGRNSAMTEASDECTYKYPTGWYMKSNLRIYVYIYTSSLLTIGERVQREREHIARKCEREIISLVMLCENVYEIPMVANALQCFHFLSIVVSPSTTPWHEALLLYISFVHTCVPAHICSVWKHFIPCVFIIVKFHYTR